jgi:hypothetical protein
MANGFVVTKEDWERMTPAQQSWMTYNAVQNMDDRVQKLENRKWLNSGCSFTGGVIGGFLSALGLKSVG